MFVISAVFEISPEHSDEFISVALRHAHNTKINETGCLGFDVFVNTESPHLVYFHETYTNKGAVDAVHVKAHYYADFRALTDGWIVSKELRTWTSVV